MMMLGAMVLFWPVLSPHSTTVPPITFMFGVCIVLPHVCGFCCGCSAFLLQLRHMHARMMLMACINRQTCMFSYLSPILFLLALIGFDLDEVCQIQIFRILKACIKWDLKFRSRANIYCIVILWLTSKQDQLFILKCFPREFDKLFLVFQEGSQWYWNRPWGIFSFSIIRCCLCLEMCGKCL